MRIAVLGLGRMGQAIAHRMVDGGHEVTVWNRTRNRADELVTAGATEADSPGHAVTAADVAVSSLANDDAVRQVTLGPDQLLAHMGSRPYVDASTISVRLSGELAESSSAFVALPILGAPQAVRSGQAVYLAGGAAGTIDELQPMLDSLGGPVKRYDRPEKASTAKLAVNLLLLSGIAAAAEALTVGRAGGLSDEQLTDLLKTSPMFAPGLENRLEALVHGAGPAWWTTALAAKDAGLAADVVHSRGGALRLAPMIHDLYQAAVERGLDGEDIVALARLYR